MVRLAILFIVFLVGATAWAESPVVIPERNTTTQSSNGGEAIGSAIAQSMGQVMQKGSAIAMVLGLIYLVYIAIGLAFNQAGIEDVVSWVYGYIFVVGAAGIANIFMTLF